MEQRQRNSTRRKCLRVTCNLISIFIGGLVGIVLFPVTIPILFILWLWRSLVVAVIWIAKAGKVTVASGMEAMWGLDEPGARAVISTALILKGQVKINDVRSLLEEHILNIMKTNGEYKYPRFRQYLQQIFGVSVWLTDREFCIEKHVRNLSPVEDETAFVNLAAKLGNIPLPSERPQWEVLLIPIDKYTATPINPSFFLKPMAMSTPLSGHKADPTKAQPSHSALLLRLHHALGDGRSLVQLMLSALIDPATGSSEENAHIDPVLDPSSKWLFIMRKLWAFTQLPLVAWRLMVRHDRSPLHGIPLSGSKKFAWAPPINLQHFRTIKRYTKASVNDSLLTCTAAAIHR